MSAPPPIGGPPTLIDLLRMRARQFGDKLVFRYLAEAASDPVELTYAQLDERARKIAIRLQALCGANERALLVFHPGLDYVTAFFGCVYSGNLAVPVFPPRPYRPAPRLEAIVADARPSIVLSTAAVRARAAEHYDRIPGLLDLPWLVTDELRPDADRAWKQPQTTCRSTAFLQYTSGSTAQPRGVVLSHQNLLHNSAAIQRAFGSGPEDHGVFWLPLYHDMGLIGGVLQTVYAGASSTLMSPVAILHRPRRWLETISQTRATVSGGPDFAYDLCCRKISTEIRRNLDLSSWRVAFSGAEPVRAETIRRFVDAFAVCGFRREAFLPCYGLAEATLLVSARTLTEPLVMFRCEAEPLAADRVVEAGAQDGDAHTLVSCGPSAADQRIAIVDPQTLRECEPDRVGEIWVSGTSVAGGYFGARAASEATFQAHLAAAADGSFLRTGDLGFLRDGALFITGRLKDLIIICGRNYYPQDIEWSAQECHARLRPSAGAAFSVEVDGREQLVLVHEVQRHRRELDADEVVTAIRQVVASKHELEAYCVVLVKPGGVPKTPSGKIRRHACRAQFLSNQLDSVACWRLPASVADAGDSQDRLVRISPGRGQQGLHTREEIRRLLIDRLSARLHVPGAALDVNKPFAEFGMTSLQAVDLAEDLEQRIDRPVTPTWFFNYPTINALADYLAQPHAASSPGNSTAQLITEPNDEALIREVGTLSDQAISSLIADEVRKPK